MSCFRYKGLTFPWYAHTRPLRSRNVPAAAPHSFNSSDFAIDMLRAMAVLIEHPLLALAPVVLFAVLFALSNSRLALTAGLLWLAYFAYEYAMKLRILCSGECNIRIDLLVLYPALILISLASLVMFAVAVWRKGHA